jgi:Neugrin
MDGLRELHMLDPETFTTPVLAERFRVSPEAVRRILKSKWEPTREQRARFAEKERRQREQYIQASRLEEMMRQMEVEQERRSWEKPPPRPDGLKSGRVRGVNTRDTLTFE